ncbi:MAG: trimeric intracellular cation channel family protein [Planctomycetota bacterium]
MIEALQYLAVISAGLYGVLQARSKGMDAVGVCWVAFLVAFGGGTLRDVLLDRQPLFWIEHEHYTWTLFAIAVLGAVLPRLPRRLEGWLLVPDALGLALFSVVGAGIAAETGVSPFVASLFGVITGAFGGVIADVVCNELPRLFLPSTPLYSVCAFVGCWVYLLLRTAGVGESVTMPSAVATVVALRLLAVRRGWTLSRAAADAPGTGR